jgi:hypothetical protein
MAEKQLDSEAEGLSEGASDWFRQFLKFLELALIDAGRTLPADASSADLQLAALRAVKFTLLDSGIDNDAVVALFGRIAFERVNAPVKLVWNAELNQRRFELIDKDIQGTLRPAEQVELAGLTQLMREQVDTESNLPFAGAKKLHRLLSGFDVEPAESDP